MSECMLNGALTFVQRRCPLCGAESSNTLFTDVNRREGMDVAATVVRCTTCSMHYLNPAPDATSLDVLYTSGVVDPVGLDVAPVELAMMGTDQQLRPRQLARAVSGLLRGHPHDWPDEPGNGRSILDFGCLDGSKLVHWYRRDWQVAGIDLNQQAIAVARKRLPTGQFWCGDVLSMNISDRFDIIRSDNVIEHLVDPIAYLQALTHLLKPGGYLRVFVPNVLSLCTQVFRQYSSVYWMPFHLNLFSPITLREAFHKVGLCHTTCHTFTPLGAWNWTQRQFLLSPGFNRREPS
jgi:SAM-dependent methyltransferase